jgi:hypothetical protein
MTTPPVKRNNYLIYKRPLIKVKKFGPASLVSKAAATPDKLSEAVFEKQKRPS